MLLMLGVTMTAGKHSKRDLINTSSAGNLIPVQVGMQMLRLVSARITTSGSSSAPQTAHCKVSIVIAYRSRPCFLVGMQTQVQMQQPQQDRKA